VAAPETIAADTGGENFGRKKRMSISDDPDVSVGTLQTEIGQAERKILEKETALVVLENRTHEGSGVGFTRTPASRAQEAEELRQSVEGLRGRLKDLTAARDLLLKGESARSDKEKYTPEWKAAQKLCRTLKAQKEHDEPIVLQLATNREFTQKQLIEAVNLLNYHIANPPKLDDFPDDFEYEVHARLLTEYEKKAASARAKATDAEREHFTALRALQQLSAKLSNAMLAERDLRAKCGRE
jgi:hypothetical protein